MRKGIITFSIIVSLLAFFGGCSKFKVNSFVAPIWDTQFSAPLFDRTYTLGEILYKDSTYLYTTPPSNVFSIFTSQDIAGIPVAGNLEIASVPALNASQVLGNFTINSPDSIHYGILNKLPANTNGPVPQFQTDTVISPRDAFSNYKSATISNGILQVVIHNGYPAPIYFENGSIYLLDANNNPLSIPIDTIQVNSTAVADLPLQGRQLTPNPQISFTYGSPGLPFPQTATYRYDTLLAISMAFSKLEVSSANAIVPSQKPITLTQAIPMAGGTEVKSANIKTGQLNLSFTNNFNMALSPVNLVISSLDSQNVPLKRQFNLSAGGTYQEQINLSGWQLNMADNVGNPTDSIHYTLTAGIPGSNGLFVNVDSLNSVGATFSMSNLLFSLFTGVIHPKNTFAIAADTQKINLGDFASKLTGGITLVGDSTRLNLNIRSAGFPYLVHLTLQPFSSVSSSQPGEVVDTTVVILPNQTNVVGIGASFAKSLNDFATTYNKIPDEFIISGSALVNPLPGDVPFPYSGGNGVGTIADTDKINITNTISMPFDIGIINASYIDTTTKPLIGDSSTSAKMSEVDSGEVHFDITNGLPLQIKFIPQLIDTLDGSITTLDSVIVAPPTQYDNNGIVVSPIFSPNTVKITGDQARKFGRSFMRFNFSVITPKGSTPVPFAKNNTIQLKVYADLVFKVNKSLTGGK